MKENIQINALILLFFCSVDNMNCYYSLIVEVLLK